MHRFYVMQESICIIQTPTQIGQRRLLHAGRRFIRNYPGTETECRDVNGVCCAPGNRSRIHRGIINKITTAVVTSIYNKTVFTSCYAMSTAQGHQNATKFSFVVVECVGRNSARQFFTLRKFQTNRIWISW